MQKAVIYSRVSSDEQKKEGFSIEAQEDLMKKYAQKNGLEIVKIFSESQSAKDTGRKEFNAMISFIRKNKSVEHMIFEKNDRAIRNEFDSATLIELATKTELKIHLVKDDMILHKKSKPYEFFIFTLNTAISALMPRNLSNEVVKGMQKKADKGYYPTKAPVGYINVRINGRSNIEIDPKKAPFVRKVFELYATGNYSYRALAEEMTRQGFSISRSVKCNKTNVEIILKNPVYMGDFIWKGKRYYNAHHEKIVSPEIFYTVQYQIKTKCTTKANTRNFLFSNIIKCEVCGCSMVGELKKGKYIYYHCTGNRGGECRRKYINQEAIEKEFLDILKGLYVPKDYMPAVLDAVKNEVEKEKEYNNNKIKEVDKKITTLKSRLDKLFIMRIDGEISEEMFNEKNSAWQGKLNYLLANYTATQKNSVQIFEYAKKILELCEKAYSLYLSSDDENKRKIIKTLCSNFLYDGSNLVIELKSTFKHLFKSADFGKTGPSWTRTRDLTLIRGAL